MLRRILEIIYYSSNKLKFTVEIIIPFIIFSLLIHIMLQSQAKNGYERGYNDGLRDFSEGLSYNPNRPRPGERWFYWESPFTYKEGYEKGFYKYSKEGLPKLVNGMSQKEVLDRLGEPNRKTKINAGTYASEVWSYPMAVIIFKNGKVTMSSYSKSD
jgi:hypothetical protein